MKLSKQQENIVNAPLQSLSVIACAGSGKTKTAIHRLANMRAELRDERGYMALLSFSNVAVKTFRDAYAKHLYEKGLNCSGSHDRVVIETLDSFITSNILRPHASRTMGSKSTPFLISGGEHFLNNEQYKFWAVKSDGESYPIQNNEVPNISVKRKAEGLEFFIKKNDQIHIVNNGLSVLKKLGKVGAYTHTFGKLWAWKVLSEQKGLLNALAKRYPHIIIDEAQDLDPLHGVLIEKLISAGVKVSLIGDPNQAIYEFNGANGDFLKDTNEKTDSHLCFPLSKNYRSIKDILDISNTLSGNNDKYDRLKAHEGLGAYYVVFDPKHTPKTIDMFTGEIERYGLDLANSVVLYRGRRQAEKINGSITPIGQGKTKLLIEATVHRDIQRNYFEAYKKLATCVFGLICETSENIESLIAGNDLPQELQELRRKLWKFVRCPNSGLPSASLKAKSEWHPKAKTRVQSLLAQIKDDYGYIPVKNLGHKLSAARLEDTTIDSTVDSQEVSKIRIDTVHQVKGESLSAVLYLATKREHIGDMLEGTNTEVGRIGYVALTRAKDLFILGVPKSFSKEFTEKLSEKGFVEWKP
ncbi:ATP-dependent helicase [Vibrio parahaemolyticus]|nr:ATP-dependent helicase [Vibrio parahaemolyticus]EHU5161997.1 ATP-dependent helicase [Vibrio parahaemolyticus]